MYKVKSIRLSLTKWKIAIMLVVLGVANVVLVPQVFASTMTNASIMETNMVATGTSALIVSFKAGASDAAGSLVLNMGSGTTAVAAAPSVATTYNGVDCKTITGAANDLPSSSTLSSSGNTNPTITISNVAALTSGQSYCVVVGTFAAQTAVTNASAGGYTATITDASDTATVYTDVISSDQVVVSATVPGTFTFSLTGTTDNLGSLSTGAVAVSTGVSANVTTNAQDGWFLWGSDSNIGLNSTSTGHKINSTTPGTNATLTAGTEGYVSGIASGDITQGSGAGVTSATAAYTSNGTTTGSGLDNTPRLMASSTGTANAAAVKVHELAAISGNTPPATDYSDTVTLVGAGSF